MARRDIPTDVIGTSHLVREYTNLNFEECFPITQPVTKTVGAGKDFETFHEAMLWASNRATIGQGAIWLSLDDGIHVAGGDGGQAVELGDSLTYYMITNNLLIASASEDKANCTITTPDYADDADAGPTLFWITGGELILANITIDFAAGEATYPERGWGVYIASGNFRPVNVDILCGVPLYLYGPASGCYAYNLSLSAAVLDEDYSALTVQAGAYMEASQLEILTGDVGVTMHTGGRLLVPDPGNLVIGGGVTLNRNIPLNQIQYDGSYISTGSALSFKP